MPKDTASPRSAKRRRPAGESGSSKVVLGWREWAALPEFGIDRIKVKVDTGARTSAMHAFNVVPFQRDGEDWVRFDIHPFQRDDRHEYRCEGRAVDYRWVTNSGGGREKRFVVETALRLGGQEWPVEITLTDRDQMGFRMLVGRTAISDRFVVDPARSYCVSKQEKRKRRKTPKTAPIAAGSTDEEE